MMGHLSHDHTDGSAKTKRRHSKRFKSKSKKSKSKRSKSKRARSSKNAGKRCKQCGMINCHCPGTTCKCKPIAGWEPGKGFKKAMAKKKI